MQLINHDVWNAKSLPVIDKAAHAWLDARKAIADANEKAERARAKMADAVEKLAARVAGVTGPMPDAFEKLTKGIEAAMAAAKKSEDDAKNSVAADFVDPFEPVDASAVEEFKRAVDQCASLFDETDAADGEAQIAARNVEDAIMAERAAFDAFRKAVAQIPFEVGSALGAVEEIRRASEQSKAMAKALIKRADALRKKA